MTKKTHNRLTRHQKAAITRAYKRLGVVAAVSRELEIPASTVRWYLNSKGVDTSRPGDSRSTQWRRKKEGEGDNN